MKKILALISLLALGCSSSAFANPLSAISQPPKDPKVALGCQLVGGTLLAAAVAFHLDGK
jgi:hypothetical protein